MKMSKCIKMKRKPIKCIIWEEKPAINKDKIYFFRRNVKICNYKCKLKEYVIQKNADIDRGE